jgi:hypothetical protein
MLVRVPTTHLAPRVLLTVALLLPSLARAADPLKTIRAFCIADGRGDRIDPLTWPSVAPLLAWRLEPAWDRLLLVQGYEVGTPILAGDEVTIDVDYTVLAEVWPGRVEERPRVERHRYRLGLDETDGRWRILPPPPVPYVFRSEADADTLAKLLDVETARYVSASELVWRLVRGAGWDLPHDATPALASSGHLTRVETPRPGDLVFYFDGDVAYQVGLLESAEQAIFATLNAGIRRAPVEAFAGRIEYRRLLTEPRETPTAPATPSPASTPTAAVAP